MRRPSRPAIVGLLLSVLLGGSAVLLVSARSSAHGTGTVFSSPVDGDVAGIFWNPAAMSLANNSRFDLVANFSIPSVSYARDGVDEAQTGRAFPRASVTSVRPEPVLGVIIDRWWRSRMRLGFAISVPQAGGASFPDAMNDASGERVLGPTRYYVTSALAFHVYTQLAASFVVHRTLSIGASLNIVASHVAVDKHIDLANQDVIRDSFPCADNALLGCENPAVSTPVSLRGRGASAGVSLGALWRPIPRLRIGVGYVSPVKIALQVGVTIDNQKLEDFARQFLPNVGSFQISGSGTATLTLPQRLHIAVAFDVHPKVELMALVRWINYSATEIISATINEKSSSLAPDSLSIPSTRNDEWMASLRVVGRPHRLVDLAFSFEYATNTVPDLYMTPSNLDFGVIGLNLGVRVPLARRITLGATYAHSIIMPRTITQSVFANDAPSPYNAPAPTGTYAASSERIGLDVSAAF